LPSISITSRSGTMRALVSRTIAPFTRTRPASTSLSPSLREHTPSFDKPRATLTVPRAGDFTCA
jgi:hypothetical protein